MYVFGRTIETAKGAFKAGEPLPPEWTGKETIRQLDERFGEGTVLIAQDAHESLSSVAQRLSALEASINEIKEALGVGEKKKKLNA